VSLADINTSGSPTCRPAAAAAADGDDDDDDDAEL